MPPDKTNSPRRYYAPTGGLPPQSRQPDDKAIFTTAYALIPKGVMSDIVTSFLPHWNKTRLWVLARPLSGFAETFSHYLVETAPCGGSSAPAPKSPRVMTGRCRGRHHARRAPAAFHADARSG